MMPKREFLLSPGPVNVPRRVSLAGAAEMVHHRSEEFGELMQAIDVKLKKIFKTKNFIVYLASTGTGGMEATVANLLNRSNEAIVVEGGKFGQRWRELCQAFQIKHHVIPLDWGRAVKPEQIEQALKAHPRAKFVFTQLFETSTGTAYDIENIAKVTKRHEAILVVDAISSLGAVPLETDAWGIDVVITCSQKSLMLPPGLAFVSLSERAWKVVEQSDLPKYYWDFKAYKKNFPYTPYTSAVSLLRELNESLDIIDEEGGVGARLCKFEGYAQATRAAIEAMNLKLFSERPGAVCTTVQVPTGISDKAIMENLRQEFQIKIEGGQDHLKGKILRIGHIGDVMAKDVLGTVAALEITLHKLGHKFELGAGSRAAIESFVGATVMTK
ncbi:alanine--glyoxylate aminotransferase family protein [Candidatus Acetothermia bacterium]|nr:alanine--glyoxylate aminotransferase family protein [Candidatus Acetothermia bacterium]